MKIKTVISIILCIFFIWLGCSKNPTRPVYQREMIVFGYLWGNEPLNRNHAVSIKYTQPLDQAYDNNKAAIHHAEVTLTDSLTGESWKLQDSDEMPGLYYNEDLMIQPMTTYILRIEAEDKIVTASTTVPPAITITSTLRTDTVNIETQKNLGYRKPVYVDCDCPNDVFMLVDMYCEESWENARYINPFFGIEKPESPEEYDGGMNAEPRHIQAYLTYQDLVTPDFENQHTIFWYASMIVFYGRQTMQVMTVDDNFKNYSFSEHPVYEGGIHGGLGLFSSMCGKRFELNIVEE